MYVRCIFLYNAKKSDAVRVNGKLVKVRDKPERDLELRGGLRVIFADNFADARAAGIQERIDSLFLDLNELRGRSEVTDFAVLGRRAKISVEVL